MPSQSLTWNLRMAPWNRRVVFGNHRFLGSMLNFGTLGVYIFDVDEVHTLNEHISKSVGGVCLKCHCSSDVLKKGILKIRCLISQMLHVWHA